MGKYELKLPHMGESVAEATLTNWLKKVGDSIKEDDALLEVATDKVDSEVISEYSGVLVEQRFKDGDVIKVGDIIAIIESDNVKDNVQNSVVEVSQKVEEKTPEPVVEKAILNIEKSIETAKEIVQKPKVISNTTRFYSPLVKNIALTEGLKLEELDLIEGTGSEGRVTKSDIINYIEQKQTAKIESAPVIIPEIKKNEAVVEKVIIKDNDDYFDAPKMNVPVSVNGADEIIEMDRMRRIIAQNMRESVQTSVHVQSFMEADVTNIWNWREKVKDAFEKREGEKLTFTPVFMLAIAKALKDYPMMNISVDGTNIIKKKNVNLGMAAALPSGNLIVPVIKNADTLSLVGMVRMVNDLANRAKNNKLKPDDVMGGTFTVSNIGSFGSLFGTPVISQPQVGILALGAIRKVPAVIETPQGDFIGIRQKMFITHAYDHRVVDGALGGLFLKRVVEYLENWNAQKNCF